MYGWYILDFWYRRTSFAWDANFMVEIYFIRLFISFFQIRVRRWRQFTSHLKCCCRIELWLMWGTNAVYSLQHGTTSRRVCGFLESWPLRCLMFLVCLILQLIVLFYRFAAEQRLFLHRNNVALFLFRGAETILWLFSGQRRMRGEWGEWKCQKVNLHEHTQCTEINSQRSGGCLEGAEHWYSRRRLARWHFNTTMLLIPKKKKQKGGGVVFLHCHLKQQKANFTAVETVTTCQNVILSHIRKIAYHDFY